MSTNNGHHSDDAEDDIKAPVVNLPAMMQTQSLAVQLEMATLNQSVATARAFPRTPSLVMKAIKDLVMLDKETAKECVYALPRGGKPIRGPSVRMAEIVASSWGNCDVASRIVHTDYVQKFVEAEGIFHDLETGMRRVTRSRRSIADKYGKIYNQDMILMTSNAAASIAIREAILKGIPKAAWREAFILAERVIAGDVKTLVERRGEAMKAFAAFGVKPEQVFAVLDVKGMEDITIDHMPDLSGMYHALKSGDVTVEEMFEPKKIDAPKDLNGRLGELAKQAKTPAHDPETGEIKPEPKKKAEAKPAAKAAAKETAPTGKATPSQEQKTAGDGDSSEPSELSSTTSPAATPAEAEEDDGNLTIEEYLAKAAERGTADRKAGKAKKVPKAYSKGEAEAYVAAYDEEDANHGDD